MPLLRPAILAAFILSLTRLLSSFETEVFLGTSSGIYVLTNKIYVNVDTLQEFSLAGAPSGQNLFLMFSDGQPGVVDGGVHGVHQGVAPLHQFATRKIAGHGAHHQLGGGHHQQEGGQHCRLAAPGGRAPARA